MPDEDAIVPMLIGRDLMNAMNIKLCQIHEGKTRNKNKITYSRSDLFSLENQDKENKLQMDTTDALESFDLYKCPQGNRIITDVPTKLKMNHKRNRSVVKERDETGD